MTGGALGSHLKLTTQLLSIEEGIGAQSDAMEGYYDLLAYSGAGYAVFHEENYKLDDLYHQEVVFKNSILDGWLVLVLN